MKHNELKKFLDFKYDYYNRPEFISSDPVSIPHGFTKKEDIEISAFLSAIIAWGYRPSIIKSASRLMAFMNDAPYDFVLNASYKELQQLKPFVHRTFNSDDLFSFLFSLKNIYQNHKGLQEVFYTGYKDNYSIKESIIHFRKVFFESKHLSRTMKHVSNPENNSSCKRINMFLRWMIRNDNRGVDFGIWNNFSPSSLMCPLDVHSGNVSRKLELLNRKQSDWKAVEELTANLRILDPADPVKYDFALFGLGVFEKF